ncbi:hypothetical protein HDU93_008534, partial [Gonapodya sp. JEL0774]
YCSLGSGLRVLPLMCAPVGDPPFDFFDGHIDAFIGCLMALFIVLNIFYVRKHALTLSVVTRMVRKSSGPTAGTTHTPQRSPLAATLKLFEKSTLVMVIELLRYALARKVCLGFAFYGLRRKFVAGLVDRHTDRAGPL